MELKFNMLNQVTRITQMPEMPINELVQNIFRNFEEQRSKPRPCRRCGVLWTPGTWNFHDLCDPCFVLFDTQKMKGRFSSLPGIPSSDEKKEYFESVDKWLESQGIPVPEVKKNG